MPDALTQRTVGAAIEVHRVLGPGLLEAIYEEALCVEFQLRGIGFGRQVEWDVNYKGGTINGQRRDLLVERGVVVELEAVANLPDVATAQVFSYLKAAGQKRAPLINFGVPRLGDGIKRLSL
jgi:GxxExxY protein